MKKSKTPPPTTRQPSLTIAPSSPPKPHPLDLNANELRWMDHLAGPYDGWFHFGEHGNPPVGVLVQIVSIDPKGVRPSFVGAGRRTAAIDQEHGKERWECMSSFDPMPPTTMMLGYWRPLAPLPEMFRRSPNLPPEKP